MNEQEKNPFGVPTTQETVAGLELPNVEAYKSAKDVERMEQLVATLRTYAMVYDWLWENCKIVYSPPGTPEETIPYPIEHFARVGKDSRTLIEHEIYKQVTGPDATHDPRGFVDNIGGIPKPGTPWPKIYNSWQFYKSCMTMGEEEVHAMTDQEMDITRDHFLKFVDICQLGQLEKQLGYDGALFGMGQDQLVTYHASKVGGRRCVYFQHSRIEYVFLEPEDQADIPDDYDESDIDVNADWGEGETSTLTLSVHAQHQDLLKRIKADRPDYFGSDEHAVNLLEDLIANSELEFAGAAEVGVGDLTDAPMLGIWAPEEKWADTTTPKFSHRWAFMDYQVRSFIDDLAERGSAVFVGGKIGE